MRAWRIRRSTRTSSGIRCASSPAASRAIRRHRDRSVMTTTADAAAGLLLIGTEPPPVRRDRMVQIWLVASALSLLGDAAFTIVLTWTAVHLLAPGLAGLVVAIELIPQALLMLVG